MAATTTPAPLVTPPVRFAAVDVRQRCIKAHGQYCMIARAINEAHMAESFPHSWNAAQIAAAERLLITAAAMRPVDSTEVIMYALEPACRDFIALMGG